MLFAIVSILICCACIPVAAVYKALNITLLLRRVFPALGPICRSYPSSVFSNFSELLQIHDRRTSDGSSRRWRSRLNVPMTRFSGVDREHPELRQANRASSVDISPLFPT